METEIIVEFCVCDDVIKSDVIKSLGDRENVPKLTQHRQSYSLMMALKSHVTVVLGP